MSGDWRHHLRLMLEDFVDTLVVRGASQSDVYDAIKDELEALRAEYDRDQDADAAEDEPSVVEEPSNGWPASQK